jgi:enamine deaminase RidA (YjgF/YER057c/UK114 family)
MELDAINPDSLCRPRGYSHGMKGHGDLVFVAGQVGWSREGHMVSDDFVGQFAQALDNVLDVVWAAGGSPQSVARMVIYVTDKRDYVQSAKRLGEVWRQKVGKHFPAMALVEVKGLLDDQAKVEIKAVAIV